MKRLSWIFAITLVLAACDKEDAATAVEDQASDEAVAVEEAVDSVDHAPDSSVADTGSLLVVEESAADDEPTDKAIVLAVADEAAAGRTWKYKEGKNFSRMLPTQPTVDGPDKIEVAELFMYSCSHCRDLEGHINRWEESKDPGVRLVRIPVIFNDMAQVHAQLYYTEVILAGNGKLANQNAFRNMVFSDIHDRGNLLRSEAAVQKIFERAGVSEEDFSRVWNSFEVDQAMRLGADLARRYNINSVPTMVVNGKYRTSAAMAGGYPNLIEMIDELTAREGLR